MSDRRIAIVPAFNEERNIARVIGELGTFDPALDVVVVSDGSVDGTAAAAAAAGAHVVSLPFNLGIGGAVQTGFQYARDNGYDLVVRCDGVSAASIARPCFRMTWAMIVSLSPIVSPSSTT